MSDENFQSGNTDTQTSSTQMPEANAAPVQTPHETVNAKAGMTKTFWVAGILVLLLGAVYALHAFGILDLRNLGSGAEGEPVAVVNGEEISRTEYDDQLEQTKAVFAAFGQSVEGNEQLTRELEARVLDDLINSKLLLQKAQEAGITADEAAVETQFSQTVEQVGGQEQFEAQLATIGLTEEELRQNIREQLIVETYLNQETTIDEIEVPEAEIRAVYDEQVAGTENAPAYEEIKESIKAQLEQQQSVAILEAFVAQLRADADIEVLLQIEEPAAQTPEETPQQPEGEASSEGEGEAAQ